MASGNTSGQSTRSASNRDRANSHLLSHRTRDAFDQMKEEVAKVRSLNEGTMKKIAKLIEYLDEVQTEVSLVVSSYMVLFTIVYTKAIKNELKGLQEDANPPFNSIPTTVTVINNRIRFSMHEWERTWETKFGSSGSAPDP